jgi:hypothetical protein
MRTTVTHLCTPSAQLPSRRLSGTVFSISSVVLTTVGIMRIVSAREPANPGKLWCRARIHSARTNNPATIDGSPVMTSTKKSTRRPNLPELYSTR